MKIADLIAKKCTITEGVSDLFIAERDFYVNELPIVKDSLVSTNGRFVTVNMIEYNFFESIIPMEKCGNPRFFAVDNLNECEYEDQQLRVNWRGIWHIDHFDKWDGSFKPFLGRINQIQKLTFRKIEFSSLQYKYDVKLDKLTYFISTKEFVLNMGMKKIILPELLEIENNEDGTFTIITIPMNEAIEYKGLKLRGAMHLDENGFLNGKSIVE
jgi:hypothetical protein